MARQPRREAESGIHHVMNRGNAHAAVFFADVDRFEFGRQLVAIHRDLGVTTIAYCLMTNHFHLVLRSPHPGALSDAMQHLSSVYTQRTNDRLGRDGSLFRGRFHSIPVETDAYLLRLVRYVHRNPLDIGGLEGLDRYRWSSYGIYLGRRRLPGFLDMDPVMSLLGGSRDGLVALTEDDPKPVAGAGTTTIEDLHQVVACALAVDGIASGGDEAHQHVVRTVMILLGQRTADPVLAAAIREALGERSPATAARAVRRAQARLRTDPMVGRVLTWVESELARAVPGVSARSCA